MTLLLPRTALLVTALVVVSPALRGEEPDGTEANADVDHPTVRTLEGLGAIRA